MKTRVPLMAAFLLVLALLVASVALGQEEATQPESQPEALLASGFTYQGELEGSGGLVNGNCDFSFALWSAASGGSQIGGFDQHNNVAVTDGRFTVIVNDGNEFTVSGFNGGDRWLQVLVRCPATTGTWTGLSPRQKITAAPLATYASVAPWNGVFSKPAGFADNVDNVNDSVSWSEISGIVGAGSTNVAQGNHNHLGQTWTGTSTYGLRAVNSSTSGTVYGVYATANSSPGGWGVRGDADYVGTTGIATATSGTNYGVYGQSDSSGGSAVYAYNTAGGLGVYSLGNMHVQGTLSKSAGSFKIDHPLDPENQYLQHSFVESPDMMNVYNGNVVLDENGEAWVELADWFQALNVDYRYQLTAIGMPGPNLYIAQKIENNRFKIAGGESGMEVSWQVTGVRNDPYAQANRIQVEVPKSGEEQGTYLYPDLYSKPEELGYDYVFGPPRALVAEEGLEHGQ